MMVSSSAAWLRRGAPPAFDLTVLLDFCRLLATARSLAADRSGPAYNCRPGQRNPLSLRGEADEAIRIGQVPVARDCFASLAMTGCPLATQMAPLPG